MAKRLSILLSWPEPAERKEFFERVKVMDEVGVDTIWVTEAGGMGGDRDAFSLLTLLAERTTKVKLGTDIISPYGRTPAMIAQHFATLDEFSEGRMVIGMGVARPEAIEQWHGVPYAPAATRLKESIEIIKRILAHEPLVYQGKLFHFSAGYRLHFRPYRPHIPIFIAAISPKSRRLTAKLADGWLQTTLPIDHMADEVKAFREMVMGEGRDPKSITIQSPAGVVITNHVEKAKASAKATVASYMTHPFYAEQVARCGFRDDVEKVQKAWNDGAKAAAQAVPDRLLDVLRCIGSLEKCQEWLKRQAESGIDLHLVSVDAETPRDLAQILERLID
ncbi:MAG: LLM class flavin-dependent oxidoreductase [Candidatus Tectomicrobia bacterium]|nr:LLM class flavin-dependent oxidoreductase [Candidatus Tectomicrobia bacterium]